MNACAPAKVCNSWVQRGNLGEGASRLVHKEDCTKVLVCEDDTKVRFATAQDVDVNACDNGVTPPAVTPEPTMPSTTAPPEITLPPLQTVPPPLTSNPPTTSPTPESAYNFVGYYQSWSDPWALSANSSLLAKLPPYVNIVILSFARPDCTAYEGGLSFFGTGLDFTSEAYVIRDAVSLLKRRNPGTVVLLGVGGATYTNFANLQVGKIKELVDVLGLDGVDIDYEPLNANCTFNEGTQRVGCTTDLEFVGIVQSFRNTFPRSNYVLSAAVWSVGAFGEGMWKDALPKSQYTGVARYMLQEVGNELDLMHLMAYDAGDKSSTGYDPLEALAAYQSLYAGPLHLGMEVANEGWGDHVITIEEVNDLTAEIQARNAAGVMLWSLQKSADQGPTAEQIAQQVCNNLNMARCDCGLFSGCV